MFIPFYNLLVVGGASILFFMISGALVFNRPQEFVPFIKKRLSRVVVPMVFWSIVLLVINCVLGKGEWDKLGHQIMMIPISPQIGIYWFIYVIFGIYMLTPMISTWLAHTTRREVECFLAIWGVTLLLPYFDQNTVASMIDDTHGYLYYFYGYLGFAVCGHYLRRYCFAKTEYNWKFLAAPFLLWGIIFLAYASNLVDHPTLHNRMTLHMALVAASLFLFIKKVPLSNWVRKIVYVFAQYSFGIYLVHLPVIRYLLWPMLQPLHINLLFEIPLVAVLSAILSFLIVWLFSKIVPGSKYIVGV